jgi:hypothetical protein
VPAGSKRGPAEKSDRFRSGRRSEDTPEAAPRRPAELAELPVAPGLCARCRHLRLLRGRHSTFVRCAMADTDPRFPRYPPLPVIACEGFEERGEE